MSLKDANSIPYLRPDRKGVILFFFQKGFGRTGNRIGCGADWGSGACLSALRRFRLVRTNTPSRRIPPLLLDSIVWNAPSVEKMRIVMGSLGFRQAICRSVTYCRNNRRSRLRRLTSPRLTTLRFPLRTYTHFRNSLATRSPRSPRFSKRHIVDRLKPLNPTL